MHTTIKSIGRIFLLIILLIGLSLIIPQNIKCVQATDSNLQYIPLVSEFIVKFMAYPYDVPEKTTTTIDPFTGKETVTTFPSYHVENKSIEVWIKNQPFTPYTDEEGNEINLYYDIQCKGHFGDEWTSFGSIYSYRGPQSNAQLDSEYTIISIDPAEFPSVGMVDFRVQARIGHYVAYGRNAVIFGFEFYGQESGWSKTQTFSLAETTFEVIPEFPSWTILLLFLVATFSTLIIKKRLFHKK